MDENKVFADDKNESGSDVAQSIVAEQTSLTGAQLNIDEPKMQSEVKTPTSQPVASHNANISPVSESVDPPAQPIGEQPYPPQNNGFVPNMPAQPMNQQSPQQNPFVPGANQIPPKNRPVQPVNTYAQQQYNVPPAPQYGSTAQPQQQYNVPPAPQYGSTAQPQYNAPQAPQYGNVNAQPYGYQPYGYPQKPPANGLAIAAMVCGICSIALFWGIYTGIILGILGVVFGFVARSRGNKKGFTLAGIITGFIGIALTIVMIFAIIFSIIGYSDSYDSYEDGYGNYDYYDEYDEYSDFEFDFDFEY